MRDVDLVPFCEVLDEVWGLKQQLLTAGQKATFFKAMFEFSLEEFAYGMNAHIKDPDRGRFLPMPADIIGPILARRKADGRPGGDEAWALAVASTDEDKTIVWTEEMANAWGVARVVYRTGDKVGARKSFLEAYARLVDEARSEGRPTVWAVSEGHNPQERAIAIRAAVEAGRLPPPNAGVAPLQLAGPETAAAREGWNAIMANPAMPDGIREKLQALRDQLAARADGPTELPEHVVRTRELQEQTDARVQAYQAGQEVR